MRSEKEARQVCKHGRATCGRHNLMIPRDEFDRGCKLFGTMFLILWCAIWTIEVLHG